MTTIDEILYSTKNSISVSEKKLLLSHVLGLSNEEINLAKKIREFNQDVGIILMGYISNLYKLRAEDILDIALKFPYGVDGKLNLTAHPDYQGKVNTLKIQIKWVPLKIL